jgi:hypothetical protein
MRGLVFGGVGGWHKEHVGESVVLGIVQNGPRLAVGWFLWDWWWWAWWPRFLQYWYW